MAIEPGRALLQDPSGKIWEVLAEDAANYRALGWKQPDYQAIVSAGLMGPTSWGGMEYVSGAAPTAGGAPPAPAPAARPSAPAPTLTPTSAATALQWPGGLKEAMRRAVSPYPAEGYAADPFAPPSPLLAFLEEEPEIAYRGFMPSGSQNFLDYWRQQYGKTYGNYQGLVGKQALGGTAPTTMWTDYLKNFDFGREWLKMAPWERGERGMGGLRWLIPR